MISRIHITGIVQGVGFRPFIYNLASRLNLSGFCLNDSNGVVIEVEGDSIDRFIQEIKSSAPPLSRIEELVVEEVEGSFTAKGFAIKESIGEAGRFTLVSPDIATCEDCLGELLDPADRRYTYPFINCTNCGPRYSIVKDIPYDRPNTTMAGFRMCKECDTEYHDPKDRRFHAQPNACEVCGPKVWLAEKGSMEPAAGEVNFTAIKKARRLIKDGAVLAIKGIGGFHLACDATNEDAVRRLRINKRSTARGSVQFSNKPFAIMSADFDSVSGYAEITVDERKVLLDRSRPIVLLKKIQVNPIAEAVSPNNKYFGVMLPYTPVHHMLFHPDGVGFTALVMTSGNRAEEPIVTSNAEAMEKLSGTADFFLFHDRDIHMRVDDSIVRLDGPARRVLRRGRGFTPEVIPLDIETPDILAFGPFLKNTFCITKGAYAIPSTHIGDLDNEKAIGFFTETLENQKSTFRSDPVALAHDMHPGYPSTRLALEYADKHSIPEEKVYAVQHHHAHVVSCMVEHGIKEKVIGVAFDGTGLGTDGTVWGGEFILSDRKSFERTAHLLAVPMPGGDMAAAEPWRMAISYLWRTYGDGAGEVIEKYFTRLDKKKIELVLKMLKARINSPLTSSAGRLFDAVSSILGLRDVNTFEGEAAAELEHAAAVAAERAVPYPFVISGDEAIKADTRLIIRGVVEDLSSGVNPSVISARFHQSLADVIVCISKKLSEKTGIKDVVLSGGVFQNALLAWMAADGLKRAGCKAYFNEKVPANDGGVALGQAIVAWENLKDVL